MGYINRTLVVEDNKELREIISTYLDIYKLDYDLAEDGKFALEKSEERSKQNIFYRTILTDLEMPNLDGLDLIKELKKRVEGRKILKPQIYVLTGGHKNIEEVFSLKEKGNVSEVFKKPYEISKAVIELRKFYDSLIDQ
ncbi:MAG: response regulator [Candidatus Pacearchaeota archaeon]